MNICTKFGYDILIISGSYGGHRRHTTDDGRRTTPQVWHKLPTGELTNFNNTYPRIIYLQYQRILFSSFREEDFQKFCIKLTMFKLFLPIISPIM